MVSPLIAFLPPVRLSMVISLMACASSGAREITPSGNAIEEESWVGRFQFSIRPTALGGLLPRLQRRVLCVSPADKPKELRPIFPLNVCFDSRRFGAGSCSQLVAW